MDYLDFEKEREKNNVRNAKLISRFENKLLDNGLSKSTINKHLMNIDFYVNNYLTYYDIKLVEDGIEEVSEFFRDFFARKAMWSDEKAVKSTITSLKKFYKFLKDETLIGKKEYDVLLHIIKTEKEEWLDTMNRFNNPKEDTDYEIDDYFDITSALVYESKILSKMKLWHRFSDADIIGIKFIDTNELYFVNFMGNAKQVFGVSVYENLSGLDGYLTLFSEDYSHELEMKHLIKANIIYFEKVNELDEVDRELIKNSEVSFEKIDRLPMFRNSEPGFSQAPLNFEEGSKLLKVIEELNKILPKLMEDGEIGLLSEGKCHLVNVQDDGTYSCVKESIDSLFRNSNEQIEIEVGYNELDLKRLQKKCKSQSGIYELDIYFSPSYVKDIRPYYPAMLVLIDNESGLIVGKHISHPYSQDIEFQDYILSFIGDSKVLPKTILFNNHLVGNYLGDMLTKLGVELIYVDELENASHFKFSMYEQFFETE